MKDFQSVHPQERSSVVGYLCSDIFEFLWMKIQMFEFWVSVDNYTEIMLQLCVCFALKKKKGHAFLQYFQTSKMESVVCGRGFL